MTTMLVPACRKWARSAWSWRWKAVILTSVMPDAPELVWAAMQRWHGSLRAEAAELAAALDVAGAESPSRRKKVIAAGFARMIRQIDAETDGIAEDVISPRAIYIAPSVGTGVGGLRGLRGLGAGPATWEEVSVIGRRVVAGIYRFLGVAVPLTGGYILYREVLRSPAARAADDAAVNNVLLTQRQQQLAKCATDPNPEQCRKLVEQSYDALMPGQCDILDTPLGSGIGFLVGAGFGYVGMRKIMGIT
jgi:hypothetical protein